MKQSYQDVLKRVKEVAIAHPSVKSADDGRELEFDFNKKNAFPRMFVRTEGATISGGEGTGQVVYTFTILVMDRLQTNRLNMVDVLNDTMGIMISMLATLNKEQIIRLEDSPDIVPLMDYQDTQSAGWSATVDVYTDAIIECYPVP